VVYWVRSIGKAVIAVRWTRLIERRNVGDQTSDRSRDPLGVCPVV